MDKENLIVKRLCEKSCMKLEVYNNTYKVFHDMKKVIKEIADETKKEISKFNKSISIEYNDKGEFESEFKFAADMLVFTMHTNIFEFPREHEIMKTSYVKEDITRSYCGVINMYNFLSDSFKYNRIGDVGYLVGRIFINKDFHYYVEGKRQLNFLYNNFVNDTIDKESLKKIIETAVVYCIDFDLLTPPYDTIKEISIAEMMESSSNMRMKTGKRLGFRFQVDKDDFR